MDRATEAIEALAEVLVELERAWKSGALPDALAAPAVVEKLGDELSEVYRALCSIPFSPFREALVGQLIARARRHVAPPRRCFPGTFIENTTSPKEDGALFPRLAVPHEASILRISQNQYVSSRFWGVDFEVDGDGNGREALEQHLLRSVRHSLTVRLHAAGKLAARARAALPRRKPDPVEGGPDDLGFKFEQLMLDVLNERERRARRAPLEEDMLEKTDLRYMSSSIERKRGARVQVTLTISSLHHAEKVARIKASNEYIILSPLTLADGLKLGGRLALVTPEEKAALQASAGRHPTVTSIAASMKHSLIDAISRGDTHPLGALGAVPEALRNLIRGYVEAEAVRSTAELRSWESRSGGPRWRSLRAK